MDNSGNEWMAYPTAPHFPESLHVVAAGKRMMPRVCSTSHTFGRHIVGHKEHIVLGRRSSGINQLAMGRPYRSSSSVAGLTAFLEEHLVEQDGGGHRTIGCGKEIHISCCRRGVVAPGRRGPRFIE